MPDSFYWNTVTPLLKKALTTMMESDIFSPFRLVGGTSLSLQLGHRMSDDIDLFTGADYGSVDFKQVDSFLRRSFEYVSEPSNGIIGMGMSYLIGNSKKDTVKLDVYYTTEKFIRPALELGPYRLASVDDIVAMKIDIVQRRARKKDFWDLHELFDTYTIRRMIALHKERSPFNHNEPLIRANFTDFSHANDDLDPKCLRGKYWELIRYDTYKKITAEYK